MLQKAEVKDLVVQTPLDIEKVFTPDGMSGLLQDIETQVKAHVPVIDTDEGRKDIISLAYKVSRSKSLIINTGEESIAEHAKKVKNMKVLLKTAKTFLDDLRDETRRPVTEYEAEQKRIAEAEAQKEAEKIDKRVADLLAVEVTMPRSDVAIMDDDEFTCLLGDKTFEFEERQKALAEAKAAEEKRLADEKAEREAEAKRLAKQKAEQDKIAADLKKQQDELEAKYKEMRAEKIRAEAERRLEIEAKAKVEQEAKEASDREMAAKEAEERRFALLPDKERLTEWVNSFELPSEPKLDHSNAVDILTSAVEGINDVLGRMQNRIEEL